MAVEKHGHFLVYFGCRSNEARWLISCRHGGEGGVKADSGLHNWIVSDTCYQHRSHKRRTSLETS